MSRLRTLVALGLMSLLSIATAHAQLPALPARPQAPTRDVVNPGPLGTARVQGRVLRAGTREPLRRALITLTGDAGMRRQVTTDREGRYEISQLTPGSFAVTAAKGGYVTLQYGQRRAFETGRPVVVTTGQVLTQVDFSLPRGGVIVGRITTRTGEPLVNATVALQRYQYRPDGQRQLVRAATAMPATNDLGEFRLFGLTPGEYIVSASVRQDPPFPGQVVTGPVEKPIETYFPGTASVGDAQSVRVGVGEEQTVQFSMMTGRLARVSGTVEDSSGRPAVGADLMMASSSGGTSSGTGVGTIAANGAFSIPNVGPGEHVLHVQLPVRAGGVQVAEIAAMPFVVTGEDLTGLRVTTAPGVTLNGRVEWEGRAPRSGSAEPFRMLTARADNSPLFFRPLSAGSGTIGFVTPDSRFTMDGLQGHVFLTPTGVPQQWTLKAILLNDVDISATGFDVSSLGPDSLVRVVLTDRLTEVSGIVKDSRGQPVRDSFVVLVPEEPRVEAVAVRYTRVVRSDASGAYRVRGLPAGRYVAAAVEALEQGSEWDPVFQAEVRNKGRRVTLSETDPVTGDLELLP